MDRGNSDLISVIIPVYNAELYLKKAVLSVMNQTYQNLEIILIDDGSEDSSGKICDTLSETDGRIRVIHKQNEGVSIARNIGLDIAVGTYIGFVDSDDLCEPDMFDVLHHALVSNKADTALCMFNDYTENSKTVRQEPLRIGSYNKKQIQEEILLSMVGSPASAPQCAPIMGSLWRCLFKTEIINSAASIRFKKIKMAEDLVFDVEYLCRCQKAVVVADALYNYRQFSESSSRKYITDLEHNILQLHYYLQEVLEQNNIFNKRMNEYFQMTVLYNLTWCISNECKYGNPASEKDIVVFLKKVRNLQEYKNVLQWKYINGISWPEKLYFVLIKLRLYRLILWFNRRKK